MKHLKYVMGSGKLMCRIEPQKVGVVRVCEDHVEAALI